MPLFQNQSNKLKGIGNLSLTEIEPDVLSINTNYLTGEERFVKTGQKQPDIPGYKALVEKGLPAAQQAITAAMAPLQYLDPGYYAQEGLQKAGEVVGGKLGGFLEGAALPVGVAVSFITPSPFDDVSALGRLSKEAKKYKTAINLKRDVPVTDIYGKKSIIPAGEALTPYELKGNKVLLQDGETYIVSKSQAQNIMNNAVKSEARPFAPELEGLEESVRGNTPKVEVKKIGNSWVIYTNGVRTSGIGRPVGGGAPLTEEQALRIAREQAGENFVTRGTNPTKFSQYQLPGGKNYKEILIKAPGGTFKDPHFGEPTISHLRLNTRDYKGKQVTFMEEAQSDWARAGRERGFATPENTIPKNPKSLLPEGWRVSSNGDTWKVLDATGKEVLNKLGDGIAYGGNENVAIGKAIGDERLMGGFKEGVPHHPLVEGGKWVEPTVKTGLIKAVDNNSEYFSWITGEQTIARYNLALKDITHAKRVGDKIEVVAGGSKQTLNQSQESELLKLLGDRKSELEKGIDLKKNPLTITGEWAKNLYDEHIKNLVKDVTGGKVEKLDMGLPVDSKQQIFRLAEPYPGEYGGRTIPNISEAKVLDKNNAKVGLQFHKGAEGQMEHAVYIITDVLDNGKIKATSVNDVVLINNPDAYKNIPENMKEVFDLSVKTTEQWGIKLTPEIKAKIRGEAPQLKKPSGREPFGKTQSSQVFSIAGGIGLGISGLQLQEVEPEQLIIK